MVADSAGNASLAEANATISAVHMLVFDEIQFTINIIGIFANVATLVTLGKNGDGFSPIISLILKYQSALDASNCLLATLTFKLPNVVRTGHYAVDALFCHLWTTQHLYWTGTFLSIWNLVTLAAERYYCVCHALKYQSLTKTKIWLVFLVFIILGFVYLLPGVFQTNMHSGSCVHGLFWPGPVFGNLFLVWVLSIFVTYYATPTLFFIVLYGLVIREFRKRANTNLGASGTSSVIEKASAELTKTAVVVTLVFIVAYSYDAWLFLLSYAGLLEYPSGSTLQKIGALLATVNLVANPFVYACLLPQYRKSFAKTYFFLFDKSK